jgi:SAM-dependent methyltransferase
MTDVCAVCGGAACDVPVFGQLARCRACGFVFLPRTPDLPERIAALYAGDYFTGGEFGDYASQHASFARNFRAYLRRMQRSGATGGRLLEVGCAYGFFLEQAQRSFDAIGIDVNEPAIVAARALGVRAARQEFLTYSPDALFDVVCLWDTIEHLLEPLAYLEKARDVLVDGGLLFLTTGDIGSAMARLRGAQWRMIHPPSHLNYFSRATITRVLDRVGFDVEPIHSVGTRRDFLNALHLLGQFSKKPLVRRAAASIERMLAGRLPSVGIYVNLHDVMLVAAKRRPRA